MVRTINNPTKKYDGKVYNHMMTATSKRQSDQNAKKWRKRGYSVRVEKPYGTKKISKMYRGYTMWIRKRR